MTVLTCNLFVWNFIMRTKLTYFGKKIWQYMCKNPIYHSSYMFKFLLLKFLNLWDSNIIFCFAIFLFNFTISFQGQDTHHKKQWIFKWFQGKFHRISMLVFKLSCRFIRGIFYISNKTLILSCSFGQFRFLLCNFQCRNRGRLSQIYKFWVF